MSQVYQILKLIPENLDVSNKCINNLNSLYQNLDKVTSKSRAQKNLEEHVGRCMEKLLKSRELLLEDSKSGKQRMIQCLIILKRIILDVDSSNEEVEEENDGQDEEENSFFTLNLSLIIRTERCFNSSEMEDARETI